MIKSTVLATALAGFALGASAQAQDRQAAREACMADYKTHCTGILPGGGRVKKCLTDNVDKLAPACKAAVIVNAGTAPKEK